jgi:predicted transcriptional regulator
MLSEVLDVPFRRLDNSYLFTDSQCVIYEQSPQLVLVGQYSESQPASVASNPRESE